MRAWLMGQLGSAGSLRRQLVHGGAGSIALKMTHLLIAFGVTVVLARVLGAEGYGVYAYVLALVNVLIIPAQFGLPVLVVRETAKCQISEQWDDLRGLWRWSTVVIVATSGGIVLVGSGVAWSYSGHFSEVQLATFVLGLLVVPFLALGNLRAASLRGLRRVVQSQIPEELVRPILMLLLVVLLFFFLSTEFEPAHGMLSQLAATVGAYLVGIYLLSRNRPVELQDASTVYRSREWLSSALPLALSAGTLLLTKNIDIIMLGWFVSAEGIGSYRVAVQVAMLAAFGLKAINMVVAPYFARMYRSNDLGRLQRIATGAARSAFVFSLPLVLVLMVYGETLITLIFGSDFSRAAMPLLILAIAQLINSSVGSVGYLMNMTGYELVVTRVVAMALALNVVLNVLLIPRFGEIGAAIATALSLAAWNLILWLEARRRLGIDSSILNVKCRKADREAS